MLIFENSTKCDACNIVHVKCGKGNLKLNFFRPYFYKAVIIGEQEKF